MIARDFRRMNLSKSLKVKRLKIKNMISNKDIDLSERYELVSKLSRMPRNSSFSRVTTRCQITGRPKGVYKKFLLCRNKIRELSPLGLIPGLRKSSW